MDSTIKRIYRKNQRDFKAAASNKMSDWIESEGKIRWIKSVFSPNKHMSGTYLFPQMANANIIIEIQNSWCLKTTHFENLIEQLKSNQKLKISEIMVSNAL